MSFGNRRRVDEDLERIRKANLPPDQLAAEEEAAKKAAKQAEQYTARDILSMILAAFSVILPYVAVFVGLLGLVWLIIWLMAR